MRQTSLLITVSLFLLFILVFLNLFSGSVSFSMAEVVAALTGGETSDTVRFIVVESRLPQAVTAMLSGAALAVSGLMMQTVFQNPLADPSILGVNSGASLGVAVAHNSFVIGVCQSCEEQHHVADRRHNGELCHLVGHFVAQLLCHRTRGAQLCDVGLGQFWGCKSQGASIFFCCCGGLHSVGCFAYKTVECPFARQSLC